MLNASGIVSNITDTSGGSADPHLHQHSTPHHLISGLWILIITSFSTLVYSLFQRISTFLTNSVCTSVTITNQDQPYDWLMSYLQQDEYFGNRDQQKNVKVNLKLDDLEKLRQNAGALTEDTNQDENTASSMDALLEKELGDGAHWIKYKQKHWLHIHVSSADKLTTRGWDNTPFQMQTITITVYGKSSHSETLLTDFINEAKRYYTEKKFESSAKIYLVSKWGSWMRCGKSKAKRRLDSVILDKDLANFLLNDAKTFLSQKQWYMEHGIPYRRGYCIHGPPGSGKSSFVVALASELSLGICVLTLSSNNLDDQSLNELLHSTPPKSIILLEDIDAVFVAREATEVMDSNRVTFSGLLNALDGVAAQEDKIFFMTTNHIDKLDPALLRPGRCDIKVRFDYASKQQVRDMWLRFNPKCTGHLLEKFVDSVPEFTVSCSALQEHFLKYEDPVDAVEHFHDLLRDPKRERQDIDAESSWKESTGGRSIGNWLLRLGIPQYTATFHSQGYYNLEDIGEFDQDILCSSHETIPEGHLTRIEKMLEGQEHVKSNFQLVPRWRALEIYKEYYGDDSVPPIAFLDQVTGKVSSYQLMEHFENYADASEATAYLDELMQPRLDWEMSASTRQKFYRTQSTLEFLESVPMLSTEDVREIHSSLAKEEVYNTDDLLEVSDLEKHVKHKGKKLEIQFAIEKLKKQHEKLKSEEENRRIGEA